MKWSWKLIHFVGIDVILFSIGQIGSVITRELQQRGHRMLGIVFDPNLVHRQEGNGNAACNSDAEHPEFLAQMYSQCGQGYSGQVEATAHSFQNAEQLKDAGADHVLMPYVDKAAEAVGNMLGQVKQPASGSITSVKQEG